MKKWQKIRVSGGATAHSLCFRTCPICGKFFCKYSKARACCSERCEKINHQRYNQKRWQKIKISPELRYQHRKGIIEQREQERKAKIRQDLPNIKQALAEGDEKLVDYLFDHYGLLGSTRKYKKGEK